MTQDYPLGIQQRLKSDTKATLKLKGITGVVFIELSDGSPKALALLAATPTDQIPEIPLEV